MPKKSSKKKWTPSKEQLEAFKQQVEKTKELSKTAIRDIFDNYRTDMDTIIDYYAFASRFYNYSPKNVAMIKAQLPYSTFVQSSGAWHSMGAVPKKGTHGARILVPQKKKFIIADKDTVLKYQELTDEQRKKFFLLMQSMSLLVFLKRVKKLKILLKKVNLILKKNLYMDKGLFLTLHKQPTLKKIIQNYLMLVFLMKKQILCIMLLQIISMKKHPTLSMRLTSNQYH